MSLFDSLPHTCDLQHLAYSADDADQDFGGDVQTPQAAYTSSEPCWIQPASYRTIQEFSARNQSVSFDVYFNRNPGFQLQDYLTVGNNADGTTGDYTGYLLKILGFREATAGMSLLWIAMCEINREQQPNLS